MKKHAFKFVSAALCFMLILGFFSACNNREDSSSTGGAPHVPVAVTIEVDGQQIIIEDAAGRTVLQLLERAKIALSDGDSVSVPPSQVPTADTTIRVLRNPNAVDPDDPDVPDTPDMPDKPVNPDRVVVSIEHYYDCDGSGHGIKIITYSDGTQEEVLF